MTYNIQDLQKAELVERLNPLYTNREYHFPMAAEIFWAIEQRDPSLRLEVAELSRWPTGQSAALALLGKVLELLGTPHNLLLQIGSCKMLRVASRILRHPDLHFHLLYVARFLSYDQLGTYLKGDLRRPLTEAWLIPRYRRALQRYRAASKARPDLTLTLEQDVASLILHGSKRGRAAPAQLPLPANDTPHLTPIHQSPPGLVQCQFSLTPEVSALLEEVLEHLGPNKDAAMEELVLKTHQSINWGTEEHAEPKRRTRARARARAKVPVSVEPPTEESVQYEFIDHNGFSPEWDS